MFGYILIFVWQLGGSVTSEHVRFESLKACQDAAAEVHKHAAKGHNSKVVLLLCSREG